MPKMYQFKEDDAYAFARHIGAKSKLKGDELQFYFCPYCNGGSSRDKSTFSINLKNGKFKCLRSTCNSKGNMITLSKDFNFSLGSDVDEYYRPQKQYKQFKTPAKPIEPKPKAIEYLLSRGISEEVAKKYQITVQNEHENVLVFPFYDENGELKFIKYRKTDFDKTKDKNKEWCEAGGKPILFGMMQCEGFDRVICTEGQCFNGDAEVMTQDGWLRLENYSGQKVLQVNEDLSASFVKPKAYIVKRHIGKMVDVAIGGNYFTSTTDDHNLVFSDAKGRIVKKQAIEKIPVNYHIPTSINFDSETTIASNDEIALLLAISADGTIDVRKNTYYKKAVSEFYARFGLTKQRKVDRLIGILERLGYQYSDSVLDKGNGDTYHSICFPIKNIILADKFLPWWLVTHTSLEQKKFIIEEMVFWDGNHVNNRNQYEYMSIYKHNADVIQAVASTCGYMSTIMKKNSGGNGGFKKSFAYKVSVLLKKKNVSTQQFEEHKRVYDVDKQVYCVTVDSGMILVRQDNKISVSGNCDSLAVAQAGFGNAVSVPTGANGFTWIPYCWDWLNKFKEIIVFGDNEKGKITLFDEFFARFGEKVKCVRQQDYKDCKDANDILRKYGAEQIKICIENAESKPVNHVISLADVKYVDMSKIEKLKVGVNEVDRFLYGGLPFGYVHIIAGKRGDGKSTFAQQIIAHAIHQGYTTFTYSGELTVSNFRYWLDLQIAGSRNIVENVRADGMKNWFVKNSDVEMISEWYRDKCFVYDNSVIDNDEEEDLLKTITQVICKYGARVILIDNLMTAIDLDFSGNTDKYEKQSQFAKKLTKIALRYNVLIMLVAHRRKNNMTTDANDEISGSADITNLAGVVMSYDRDKDSEEQTNRKLIISKNRLFGKLNFDGFILKFDEKSKRIFGFNDDKDFDYGWKKGF